MLWVMNIKWGSLGFLHENPRVQLWGSCHGQNDRHCREKTCGMILQLVQFQFISGDIAIMCSGSIPTYGCQTSTVPPVCKRALATYLYNLMCPGGHLWWAGWTPATIPSNQLDISTTIKPNRQPGEPNELSKLNPCMQLHSTPLNPSKTPLKSHLNTSWKWHRPTPTPQSRPGHFTLSATRASRTSEKVTNPLWPLTPPTPAWASCSGFWMGFEWVLSLGNSKEFNHQQMDDFLWFNVGKTMPTTHDWEWLIPYHL